MFHELSAHIQTKNMNGNHIENHAVFFNLAKTLFIELWRFYYFINPFFFKIMFLIYETRFLNRAWKRPDDTINQHVKFHKAEDLRKGNKPCACFHFESCADASFDLHTVCYFYLYRGLKITVAKNVVLFTKSVCVILHSFKFHSVCHLCVYINQNK